MSSKLFEEAIADAKKLKEVAEENAKKAILEAVTPRIREFIEDQLLEGEEDEEVSDEGSILEDEAEQQDEMMDEEIVLDESAISSLLTMLGGDDIINSLSEGREVLENSVNDVINNMSGSEKEKLFSLANKINESAENLSAKNINSIKLQENEKMSKEKFYEIDLQALRESIEDEMAEMMHSDDVDEMMDEEAEEDADEAMEDMLAEIKLMLDLGDDIEEDQLPEELRGMLIDEDEDEEPLEMEEEEDSEEEDSEMEEPSEEEAEMPELPDMEELNETFEVDPRMLRQELARVKRQLQEGSVDHHFGGKGGGKAGIDGAFGGKGKKNAGVKSAFGGGKEGQDPFVNPPQINKLNEAIRHLRRKNRSQQEKLTKYRSAVVTLREQLEDLNLFNAKLLYVNKLLQNNSLTESQKKSVIKALDEAKSLDETKTLYKSLTETLASRKTLSESKRYGSSSKITRSGGGTLSESAGEVSRWQHLAGLK